MQPIQSGDLRPVSELSQAFFRASNPHVSRDAFARKWQDAITSPLRFMRSFPQAWYIDLLDLPPEKIPQAYCICLGDAHPENFGFLTFEEGSHYVFNDLDDSGLGWAAIDALRYFTTVVLAGYDKLLMPLTKLYEGVITSCEKMRRLPEVLQPDIAAQDQKELNKWLVDGEFKYGDSKRQLLPVSQERIQALVRALDERAAMAHLEVMSIAQRGRDGGGSGGLVRYLVLARDPRLQTRELLEFKESTHAATSWGRALHEDDDRLDQCMSSIWQGLTPRCHQEVMIGRTPYLLRHRLGRANVRVDKLDAAEQRQVLEAQVSLLARQHRAAFLGVDASRLDEWLNASVITMAQRYRDVYANFQRAMSKEASKK